MTGTDGFLLTRVYKTMFAVNWLSKERLSVAAPSPALLLSVWTKQVKVKPYEQSLPLALMPIQVTIFSV